MNMKYIQIFIQVEIMKKIYLFIHKSSNVSITIIHTFHIIKFSLIKLFIQNNKIFHRDAEINH